MRCELCGGQGDWFSVVERPFSAQSRRMTLCGACAEMAGRFAAHARILPVAGPERQVRPPARRMCASCGHRIWLLRWPGASSEMCFRCLLLLPHVLRTVAGLTRGVP